VTRNARDFADLGVDFLDPFFKLEAAVDVQGSSGDRGR
jgi:hypothetical protein